MNKQNKRPRPRVNPHPSRRASPKIQSGKFRVDENFIYNLLINSALTVLILLLAYPILSKIVVNQVIESLKTDYTPGPYAPGFDMDKVNYDMFKSSMITGETGDSSVFQVKKPQSVKSRMSTPIEDFPIEYNSSFFRRKN